MPDVESAAPQPPDPHAGATMESPQPYEPHPGARETDPYFTTANAVEQDEHEERLNPRHSTHPIPSNSTVRPRASDASDPIIGSNPWTTEPENAARHILRPQALQRNSTSALSGGRRGSRDRDGERKKPTRTESGRVFWGLPDFERKHRDILPEIQAGDSSESEDEDEIVSCPLSICAPKLTRSGGPE